MKAEISKAVGRPYSEFHWILGSTKESRKMLSQNIEHSINKWKGIQSAIEILTEGGDKENSWATEQISMMTAMCGMCRSFGSKKGCFHCPLFVDQAPCFQRGNYRDVYDAINAVETAPEHRYAEMFENLIIRNEEKIKTYSKDLIEYLEGLRSNLELFEECSAGGKAE